MDDAGKKHRLFKRLISDFLFKESFYLKTRNIPRTLFTQFFSTALLQIRKFYSFFRVARNISQIVHYFEVLKKLPFLTTSKASCAGSGLKWADTVLRGRPLDIYLSLGWPFSLLPFLVFLILVTNHVF